MRFLGRFHDPHKNGVAPGTRNGQPQLLSRKCLWIDGVALSFDPRCPWSVGSFCTVDINFYGYIWGTAIAQRLGIANMKFEFAGQDAIKTPKLKPHRPETLSQ